MRSCTPPSRENFGSVVPVAPNPCQVNGLAWNQTWFWRGSMAGSSGGSGRLSGSEPPAALPSRLVGRVARLPVWLPAWLPAFLLAWLPALLTPGTGVCQSVRQPMGAGGPKTPGGRDGYCVPTCKRIHNRTT